MSFLKDLQSSDPRNHGGQRGADDQLGKRDKMSHPAFEIFSDRRLPEVGGRVPRLNHLATAIDVVCVDNQDPDKMMAITFPTLPRNSKGNSPCP